MIDTSCDPSRSPTVLLDPTVIPPGRMLTGLNDIVARVVSGLSEQEIIAALVQRNGNDSELACAIQLIVDNHMMLAGMQGTVDAQAEGKGGRLFPIDEYNAWGRAVLAQQPVTISDTSDVLYLKDLAEPIPGSAVNSVVVMPKVGL